MIGSTFDPRGGLLIYEHCRPHWSQAGAVAFVTFRTADSIPESVIKRWEHEKREWLSRRGYGAGHWSEIVPKLSEADRFAFQKQFNRCREAYLDSCRGRCQLKDPANARIVADSLLHFDGDRYLMGDFVVMPNHVHLLAAFATEEALREQTDSWLHFTAAKINKLTGGSGRFWQQEPFDHLVRSVEQYDYLRQYIANNPAKARLKSGQCLYRRLEEPNR